MLNRRGFFRRAFVAFGALVFGRAAAAEPADAVYRVMDATPDSISLESVAGYRFPSRAVPDDVRCIRVNLAHVVARSSCPVSATLRDEFGREIDVGGLAFVDVYEGQSLRVG